MTGLMNRLPSGPFVMNTGRSDDNVFLKTPEVNCLILPVNLSVGYGDLPGGTVLAANVSAAGNKGLMVPYPAADYVDINGDIIPSKILGRAFVLADIANAATKLIISLDCFSRFVVGDDLVVEAGGVVQNLGAITAIDKKPGWVEITFATAATAAYTTANKASVYVECGIGARLSTAVCFLQRNRNAGNVELGQQATPGGGIFKNAAMYKQAIPNIDSAAITALSIKEYNDLLIV